MCSKFAMTMILGNGVHIGRRTRLDGIAFEAGYVGNAPAIMHAGNDKYVYSNKRKLLTLNRPCS